MVSSGVVRVTGSVIFGFPGARFLAVRGDGGQGLGGPAFAHGAAAADSQRVHGLARDRLHRVAVQAEDAAGGGGCRESRDPGHSAAAGGGSAERAAVLDDREAERRLGQRLADRAAAILVVVAVGAGVLTFIGWRLVAARNVYISALALRGNETARDAFLPIQLLDQVVFWHAIATRSVPRRAGLMAAGASGAIIALDVARRAG